MIEIIAPTGLRSSGTWSGTSWMELDVDRIDVSVNNQADTHQQIDSNTFVIQLKASVINMIITGHINTDSELVGATPFMKVRNLILAGREWYVDLQASQLTDGDIYDCGYPRIKWDNRTWNISIQKVMITDIPDYSGDTEIIFNYQLGLILAHNESD